MCFAAKKGIWIKIGPNVGDAGYAGREGSHYRRLGKPEDAVLLILWMCLVACLVRLDDVVDVERVVSVGTSGGGKDGVGGVVLTSRVLQRTHLIGMLHTETPFQDSYEFPHAQARQGLTPDMRRRRCALDFFRSSISYITRKSSIQNEHVSSRLREHKLLMSACMSVLVDDISAFSL